MLFSCSYLVLLTPFVEAYSFPKASPFQDVKRHGTQLTVNGKPWSASGANVYWLGIDENVVPPPGQPYAAPASYPTKGRITEVMNTLVTMGARTIRSQTLGVSVGHPLSLQPELNVFNDKAFETIDWTVFQARNHGLRIFAPLVDNYDYYHGGKFSFLRFRGIDVSNSTTMPQDPLKYIKHLITHVNPYTGLSYANDPTVFAYETGNELGGPIFGDKNVPAAWTEEICSYVKNLAPKNLCIDGTYGLNETNIHKTPSVDIVSDHFYPLSIDKLNSDIALARSAGKVYFAGEYDWTGNNPIPSLQSWFDVIEKRQDVVGGDHFWSLFMHDVPDCKTFVDHDDGFTLHYGDPRNSVQNNTQIRTIRQHLFAMRGKTVGDELPRVPCPGV